MVESVAAQTSLLGRLSASLKIGIVGLPNVGCAVPDCRIEWLVNVFKPESKVPAYLTVIDIAGIIKGAHAGRGLGNAFLSNISSCDAMFHFIRAFDDDSITHDETDVNPTRDMQIINEELILKDISDLESKMPSLEKNSRSNKKEAIFEFQTVSAAKDWLSNERKFIRQKSWTDDEAEVLQKYLLITAKPTIYLVNMNKNSYLRRKDKYIASIKKWVEQNDHGSLVIPLSCAFEKELASLESEEEQKQYLEENKTKTALPEIIIEGFKVLGLEYFFTAGPKEVKCWMLRKGSKSPQAAGRIHTDFEKGFIKAEVMKFTDLQELGSTTAVKSAGKYYLKGKDYIVEDGDIINFKFNVNKKK